MPDTLSAMREFRFLEDKRNGGGLTPSEEGRWQELATQLQQASAAPQAVDPVAYAQELVAQGHDPVQAFLHVGFTLEQIAESGYDVSAYQQAAAPASTDPHAYAAALVAQGYDAATAYAAAGLPVPEAAPAVAPEAQPALTPSELDFADADLIEDVSHPSHPADDGTGGWQVESRGEAAPLSPMTRPELEVWRSPAPPAAPLPEPGPVPHVDTATPVADVTPAWEPPIPSAAELAASAVASEAVASPFEPTNPEPLPPGVSDALPPSRELAAVVPSPDELPELSPDVVGALPEIEALPELEASAAEAAPVEPEVAPVDEPVAVDAREMELDAGAEEPLPELDLDRSGAGSEAAASAQGRGPLSQELELPALERHESEWDMSSEAAAPPDVAPLPEAQPALGGEVALDAGPADDAPLELDRSPARGPNTGLLPVLDASALSAEVISEGTPTRMMPALAVEMMVSRSAQPTESEWSSEITSEELPAVPEPEPLAPSPTPADEWAAAPEAMPELAAEPGLDATSLSGAPMLDIGAAHVASAEEAPLEVAPSLEIGAAHVASGDSDPAPAPVEGAGPAWPTVAELSDWSSADKGEYAAWSASAGGLHPYTDVPESELVARLVGTPPVPMPQANLHGSEAVGAEPAAPAADLFATPGAWQETAAPDWEPAAEAAPEAPAEPATPEWGALPEMSAAPVADEPAPALAFAMPSAQVQEAPPEWSGDEAPAGDVVLESGELVEEESAPAVDAFAIPAPSIRTGAVRPPSEPRPAPQPVVGSGLQVVIPPAATRKPSVVVDMAAMTPVAPPPPQPVLDIAPARVAQSAARAPSVVIDQGLLGEESPMAVDEGDFSPGSNGATQAQSQSLRLAGERRVIVHMMDGSVRRGSFHDLDLNQPQLTLASQTGIVEIVPRDRIKAIFFMLAPGATAPAIEGSKLRVTFTDGRNIVGFSGGYDPNAVGFFIIPADARTNTERVFVLKAAIRGVGNG